ncbi:AI-2E family transporter [Alteromonas sp. SM 2104]|nr:AI-2E family transporter [Alteromonas oceanisediminis]
MENTDRKRRSHQFPLHVSLTILVTLGVLYTLYFAQTLLIPVVFAGFVALLLNPLVHKLEAMFIPRIISSCLLLSLLIAPFTVLFIELAEPVQRWMKMVPKMSVHITQQIDDMNNAFEQEKAAVKQAAEPPVEKGFFDWFGDDVEPLAEKSEDASSVVEEKFKQSSVELAMTLLKSGPIFIAQILGCMVLILFLLIFGPPLFHVFVQDFPVVKNKRRVTLLVKRVQKALSRYIVTITLINSLLGIATAGVLTAFNIDDAILWGAIVGVFNFVPYVGSIFSLSVLLIVGLVQFGVTGMALLPSAVFLGLNILESQVITPAVLGSSMQVNPLIIILWLLVTGWLWGIMGVLIAVPLFVCVKLALAEMNVFPHWIKLIEARK